MPVTASFTGSGVAPTVVSAETDDLRTIRVHASEALRDDATLRSAASYTLTPQGASVARAVLLAAPDASDPTQVLVTVDGDLTAGVDAYEIELDAAIVDLAGNGMGSPAAVMFDVTPDASGVADHEALALRRLISQYRGQPTFEALLQLIGRRARGIDQEATNVAAYRGLDTAYGVGLDRLGVVLELARDGLDDARYRLRLRAAAQARASHGYPDELIAVLLTLLDGAVTPTVEEHYPAAVVFEAEPIPNADGWAFAALLRRAVAGGVLVQLLHAEDVLLFGWDDDPAAGDWAESDVDTAGGQWPEAS